MAIATELIQEKETDGVLCITLNRPDKLNALLEHAYARVLCEKSEIAVRLIKKGIYASEASGLADALGYEEQSQAECLRSLDAASGMERFLQSRSKVS